LKNWFWIDESGVTLILEQETFNAEVWPKEKASRQRMAGEK